MAYSTIKQKTGVCPDCHNGKNVPLLGGKCSSHYWQGRAKAKGKEGYTIKPRSDKRARQERMYYQVTRPKYLQEHPVCEAQLPEICKGMASEIHHKKGRIETLLNNTKYFLAVCPACHRWIEPNPESAKEMGLSVDRL